MIRRPHRSTRTDNSFPTRRSSDLNDLAEAMRATESIEAGWIHVNTPMLALDPRFPFGGYKESGVGRDGAPAARQFFTEEKTINYALGGVDLPKVGIQGNQ